MQPDTQANQAANQPASQPASQLLNSTSSGQPTAQQCSAQPSCAQPSPAQDPVQARPAEPHPAQLGSAAQTKSQIIQASCTQLGQPVFFPLIQALQTLWVGRICDQMSFILSFGFSHLRIPTFPHKGWIATRFAHWPTEAPNKKDAL